MKIFTFVRIAKLKEAQKCIFGIEKIQCFFNLGHVLLHGYTYQTNGKLPSPHGRVLKLSPQNSSASPILEVAQAFFYREFP
jgi:hypothetical protein